MGIPVMIMGESGSGKSASLRNFSPDEIGIFNVASKPLPFRQKMNKLVSHADYNLIRDTLKAHNLKTYAIDDSQYLLAFELFGRTGERGYEKFTDMAVHFYNLIRQVIDGTPEDVIVYFLHHVETDATGKVKAKTIGKMLDEKLTVEGLFSIVLLAKTDGERHYFLTQSDGNSTVKSPMELFDSMEIDNDLKMVDTKIREYYHFGG